jgi:uncharacterized protein with PQ loop repeat
MPLRAPFVMFLMAWHGGHDGCRFFVHTTSIPSDIYLYTDYVQRLGQRHQSMRRRGLLATLAKPKRLVYGIDTLAYVVSILSLLFTVDQVRIIWVQHDASGVSFLSWVFYTISAFVWLFYGIIHKDKVIIITNFLWVVFSLVIVIGVVVYG